jgi:hypothetical protein
MIPYYYLALSAMCLMLWGTAAVLMGPLPEDLRAHHLRRWPRWSVAGAVVRTIEYRRIVLPATICIWLICYVLSYAPILDGATEGRLRSPPNMLDFFVPVQWLIDMSPLREPLLRWAALFGERERFVRDSAARAQMLYWGTIPAWLYAAGWIIAEVACVVGPAWPIRLLLLRFLRAALPLTARKQTSADCTSRAGPIS